MEILNQFGVQPILLAAQVVNFLILLLILKKFMYKPLLKVLDERKKKIAESLKNAEEIEKRLADTNVEVEKILAKAVNEGQKIMDQSKEAAVQITEDARKSAIEILSKANEQALGVMQAERVKLQQEVRENLGDLVTLALEKVTGITISKKEQKEIIEKEVRNLS